MIAADDPRVTSRVRALIDEARAAGFEDRMYGAVVIATTALVGLEEELRSARHPRGAASGAVD